MSLLIQTVLDLVLIVMIGFGLYYVVRLIGHLKGLKQGRTEMERFVQDFSATVTRAETSIKSLKQVARDGGDDLERLIEQAHAIREELGFIVESADQMATRITNAMASSSRSESQSSHEPATQDSPRTRQNGVPPLGGTRSDNPPQASSRAERELLQVLQKMK